MSSPEARFPTPFIRSTGETPVAARQRREIAKAAHQAQPLIERGSRIVGEFSGSATRDGRPRELFNPRNRR